MASNTLTLEVSADDCTFPPPSKPERIPKRVLHFSDGTLEEYSTDEDDAVESEVVQQNVSQLESIDPKTLTWIPWFWYQTAVAGSKTLEVCDYLGESLASFFGITTPKYQFEIDHYQQMMAEEEELKKQQDLEMGGWVAKNSETGEGEKSKNITEAPSLQRFYIYKLPKIIEHQNKLVKQGVAYAYITSNDQNGWKLSEKAITDVTSIPGLTLAPIYQPEFRSNLLYILYNDQPPEMIPTPKNPGFYRDGAHAKGAVVGDKTGGFWMVHSVPRYAADPEKNDQHGYRRNAHWNGQSFLCITLKPMDLELAGGELWHNGIHVYAKSMPTNLQKTYSKLYEVASEVNLDSQVQKEVLTQIVKKIRGKEVTRNHCGIITSAGGTQFKVFAKSEKYLKELYSDWVAPDLNVDLLVQTWPRGHNHQTSTCRINRSVENILNIKVTDVEFRTNKDHSKWTISKSGKKPWVCVGDINKDDSQKKRGGGTVCMKNKSVWQAYFKSVIEVEKCSK